MQLDHQCSFLWEESVNLHKGNSANEELKLILLRKLDSNILLDVILTIHGVERFLQNIPYSTGLTTLFNVDLYKF